MIPATPMTADIVLDGESRRLTTLDEWRYLHTLAATAGLQWRHADATKHRLLAEYHLREADRHTPQAQTLAQGALFTPESV